MPARRYNAFLQASGWRRASGYGRHPSYAARDGTGFISGIDDLEPELDIEPMMESLELPVCGLSWYDAIAYCLWSGESLPEAQDLQGHPGFKPELWYWCRDWNDERKAHVAVATPGSDTRPFRCGGVNPDFRHSRIGLVTVRRDVQNRMMR